MWAGTSGGQVGLLGEEGWSGRQIRLVWFDFVWKLDKVADMMADMAAKFSLKKLADMELDMVADMKVDSVLMSRL